MLVHILVVVLLIWFAMMKTGATDPGRWQRFLRCILVNNVYDGSFLYLVYIEHTVLRFKLYATFTIYCVQYSVSFDKLHYCHNYLITLQ